jgi:putative hemolysin
MNEQAIQADAGEKGVLTVRLAAHLDEVRAAQRLRHRIFGEDMGATLHSTIPGHDVDDFDDHCHHLLVWDESTGSIAGYTRILAQEGARAAGGFYSETEFEIGTVLSQPGRFMELGRTCIHPDYRNGITIATLWMGVAEILQSGRYDYLIGCGSIGLDRGVDAVHALLTRLRPEQLLETGCGVRSRQPLPQAVIDEAAAAPMPPLLKAYFRLGARVAADPYWDRDFNVADVFILLDQQRVAQRYARHFLVAA